MMGGGPEGVGLSVMVVVLSVGGSAGVNKRRRLSRRPAGAAVLEGWQRTSFQEVSGGMSVKMTTWGSELVM